MYSLTNGHDFPVDGDDTDGIEQLLDLVHILVLALNQNVVWLADGQNRGNAVFEAS